MVQEVVVTWWWWAIACTPSDPWEGAPDPAGEEPAIYAIEVRGAVSGVEERTRGPGSLVRRRTWSVTLGGEAATLRAASEVVGTGPVQSYTRWLDGEAATWTGSAWVPDAVPPPSSGRWPVLDPWTLEVHTVEVAVEDGLVRWETPAGQTQARFDAGGLVWAEHGVVRMVRQAERPSALVPFDPAALFAVPVAPQAKARRAVIGHFEIDGDPFVVNAPLWAEVRATAMPPRPADVPEGTVAAEAWRVVAGAEDQREAVRRLVRHVADRLDGTPRPGSLAALESLEAGRGDCDEAAAAFVALARAVGLEADPVGGLVYARGAVGPGLYPHAWAQVRISGRAVPVDPALGTAPADASHLPLGSGAGEAAARLASGVKVSLVSLR